MVQMLHKEIYDNGIQLILEDSVVGKITDNNVVLSSGEIKAEVVISIGVTPDVDFGGRIIEKTWDWWHRS